MNLLKCHLTLLCIWVCVRILSLACSPSGTSFVCSAAASVARSGSMSETAPRVTQPISGQLQLWDTKTVKQQVSTRWLFSCCVVLWYHVIWNTMIFMVLYSIVFISVLVEGLFVLHCVHPFILMVCYCDLMM